MMWTQPNRGTVPERRSARVGGVGFPSANVQVLLRRHACQDRGRGGPGSSRLSARKVGVWSSRVDNTRLRPGSPPLRREIDSFA